MSDTILTVNNLNIEFFDHDRPETVVYDFDLSLEKGEIVGLVGESGSGKSMSAMAIAGLLSRHEVRKRGEILYNGINLLTCDRKQLRNIQGKDISVIFQEPMTALDPLKKVGFQVEEAMLLHHPETDAKALKKKALESMELAGLEDPEKVYGQFPFELSGGMRQRVLIAAAMIEDPKILIADEPTTALDVLVEAEIVALLKRINREKNCAIIFISHDLSLVKRLAGRVLVMQNGRIIEEGDTAEIFQNPRQEYTKKLIRAIPKADLSEEVFPEEQKEQGTLLTVKDLHVSYRKSGSILFKKESKEILHGISFTLHEKEFLAVAGGSGCGKSTLAKALVGINKNYTGEIIMADAHPQMIFQDPAGSLNPAHKIQWILEETLKSNGEKDPDRRKEKIGRICGLVHIEEKLLERFPGELSGGQRQRICIALALLTDPKVLIADEPVSALDVTISKDILELLKELGDELGIAVLFISHDLRVVYQLCDNVLIMKEGRIVEQGCVKEVYRHPQHEYTKQLLKAAGIYSDTNS